MDPVNSHGPTRIIYMRPCYSVIRATLGEFVCTALYLLGLEALLSRPSWRLSVEHIRDPIGADGCPD